MTGQRAKGEKRDASNQPITIQKKLAYLCSKKYERRWFHIDSRLIYIFCDKCSNRQCIDRFCRGSRYSLCVVLRPLWLYVCVCVFLLHVFCCDANGFFSYLSARVLFSHDNKLTKWIHRTTVTNISALVFSVFDHSRACAHLTTYFAYIEDPLKCFVIYIRRDIFKLKRIDRNKQI